MEARTQWRCDPGGKAARLVSTSRRGCGSRMIKPPTLELGREGWRWERGLQAEGPVGAKTWRCEREKGLEAHVCGVGAWVVQGERTWGSREMQDLPWVL